MLCVVSTKVFVCHCIFTKQLIVLPLPSVHRYTSLDGRNGTHQNPALETSDKEGGGSRYLPAHMLSDGALERAGRN